MAHNLALRKETSQLLPAIEYYSTENIKVFIEV